MQWLAGPRNASGLAHHPEVAQVLVVERDPRSIKTSSFSSYIQIIFELFDASWTTILMSKAVSMGVPSRAC